MHSYILSATSHGTHGLPAASRRKWKTECIHVSSGGGGVKIGRALRDDAIMAGGLDTIAWSRPESVACISDL